jgi:hypothetical protein
MTMRAAPRTWLFLAGLLASGCVEPLPAVLDAGAAHDAPRVGDADHDASPSDAWDGAVDAGPSDVGPSDVGPSDVGPSDVGPLDAGPLGPVVYREDLRHSPIDPSLAEGLRALARRGPDRSEDVFAKVGDSITVSTAFLACFTGGAVDLGGRDALAETIEHFRVGDAGETDPFRRVSLAAGVGWTASRALTGRPSPLEQELAALSPRFASLMFGTNDAGFVDLDSYGRNLRGIVDAMLAQGTLPILSSIPPRDDDAEAGRRVPLFNALARALAASRGLPFVDFHRELAPLPSHGLGSDGIHPRASMGGCVLTPAALRAGSNVRNLLVLEALDRLRRVVVLGESAPDAAAPRLAGSGTQADPFVIDALPFAGFGDTRTGGEASVDRWDCSPASEAGAELRFRFRLEARTPITAIVSSGVGADLDVHIVPAGSRGACLARDNRQLDVTLEAGDWELVADTYAAAGGPMPGEALVAIVLRP